MSVIVWDGKYLAADKQATNGSLARTTTKIGKRTLNNKDDSFLWGVTGDADLGAARIEWIAQTRRKIDAGQYPTALPGASATVMVIDFLGVWLWENMPFPMKIEDEHLAIGSGRDFALGALHRGADAAQAVITASVFDVYCGGGVDLLSKGDLR